MNAQSFRRSLGFLGFVSLAVLSTFAQQGAPGGRGGAGGRAGGGGGRGGVSYTPAQAIALASLNIPSALTQAVSNADTELTRASLTLPLNASDLQSRANDLANAELALALALADGIAKYQSPGNSLGLSSEQKVSVLTSGGLNRGGNTSPGGTFEYEDYTGFTSIWDGQTLNGWDGESDAWSVEDGAIHMDTSRKPGQHHIHFVGLNGVSPILRDFDLKVEFKTNAGGFNGGIQYRSRLLTGHGPNRSIYDPATIADPLGQPLPAGITTQAEANDAGINGQPWQVSGYQYDITGNNTASLYEGQGRGVIVNAGEIVELYPGGLKFVVGRTSDDPSQYLHPGNGLDGEWNQVEIIVRGNVMIHMLNGHVITVATDDDPVRRAFQGILSLQCEGGQIWYRNVYLKNLDPVASM